jgi:hypothetical protein
MKADHTNHTVSHFVIQTSNSSSVFRGCTVLISCPCIPYARSTPCRQTPPPPPSSERCRQTQRPLICAARATAAMGLLTIIKKVKQKEKEMRLLMV